MYSSSFAPITVVVGGERGCFTRPDSIMERVSYPFPPPSACHGILSSIYWKPTFKYRIKEIWNLAPVNYAHIKTNEVQKKGRIINLEQGVTQTQKTMLYLRNSKFAIVVDIVPYEEQFVNCHDVRKCLIDEEVKHRDILQRRLNKGAGFIRKPCMGLSEFLCNEVRKFVPNKDTTFPLPEDNIKFMVYSLLDLSKPAIDLLGSKDQGVPMVDIKRKLCKTKIDTANGKVYIEEMQDV